jgi:hypothetical protein
MSSRELFDSRRRPRSTHRTPLRCHRQLPPGSSDHHLRGLRRPPFGSAGTTSCGGWVETGGAAAIDKGAGQAVCGYRTLRRRHRRLSLSPSPLQQRIASARPPWENSPSPATKAYKKQTGGSFFFSFLSTHRSHQLYTHFGRGTASGLFIARIPSPVPLLPSGCLNVSSSEDQPELGRSVRRFFPSPKTSAFAGNLRFPRV